LRPQFATISAWAWCFIGGAHSGGSHATAPPALADAPVTAIAQLPLSLLVPSNGATMGDSTMHYALMMSLAVSIVLGMWVIWKITP
jgi:hypothetical protein